MGSVWLCKTILLLLLFSPSYELQDLVWSWQVEVKISIFRKISGDIRALAAVLWERALRTKGPWAFAW